MATYDLGKVVGEAGEKGDDGSSVWNTSTAPTYANSKYTFNISNLSGKTGLQIAVNDIIFYSTYYYIVSTVNTTTVDCATRISIKGSDASVTIVDNLTSTSSTSALSAKQGKVLNDNKIETSSIATTFGSTTSDSKVPSEKLVKTSLDAKQATLISGTNIKTVNNNSLLGSGNIEIQGGSNVDVVTSWEATLSDTKVPSEKLTKNSLDAKADANSLATVATTGDYDDLTDKPTIPSKISDLTNDSDFIETSSTSGLIKNDGTIDTTSYSTFSGSYNDLSNKPSSFTPSSHTHGNLTNDGKVGSTANYFVYTTTSGAITSKQKIGNITTSGAIGSTANLPIITTTNGVLTTGSFGTSANTFAEGNHTHSAYVNPTKVTSWSSTPSDDNVASEKLIKDTLDTKQATLISGTNLKTINNNSLLGSGNITIEGGSGGGGSYINDFYGDTTTNELVIDYDTGVSQADIVTSWSSTTSDTNVPSEKLAKDTLDTKISKSSTSGLVKNDGSIMTSGTGSSNYAAGNHTHSGYANASHNHNYSDVNNVSVVTVTVTYSDSSTGTIKLLQYTGS